MKLKTSVIAMDVTVLNDADVKIRDFQSHF